MFTPISAWPAISRNPFAIEDLKPAPYLSLDYEWDIRTGVPTILGVSDGSLTVSVPHVEGKPHLARLVERTNPAVFGHNILQADVGVAEREGIKFDTSRAEDTILWHWLTNMSLCKGTKKADDDEGEKRGRGFMNLFAMCSLHTNAPNWKECWGEGCEESGRPCPKHAPFDYNGNDCYWPLQAIGPMKRRARLLGVDSLYPLHRDVSLVLAKMTERGVLVNVEYVNQLRRQFASDTDELFAQLNTKFNPDSPKQVMAYFATKGVALENAQEATVREAADEYDDPELNLLCDYKELGNGPDRWFAPQEWDYKKNRWKGYVDPNGFIHCHLQLFTSTGRLACSNPNLQNVAKRRKDRVTGESLGKKIRRAIIAPEGHYLYRADLKNAENRVFLHLAGHRDLPNIDFHSYMRDTIGIKEDDPFALVSGDAREAAKTVTHATDYMEGIKLVDRAALRSPKMLREVAAGARLIFPDWVVFDKVVTFTGINLANRAFGDSSYENRRRALNVQVQYFKSFPKLRDLQKHITKQVERDRCVRPPTGYVLASYGREEDRLKTAAAMWGSNPVAHITKLALLRAEQHPQLSVVLQIHDELLFYVDKRHEPKKVAGWIRECMELEVPEIPGLIVPAEPSYGENWTDQQAIN